MSQLGYARMSVSDHKACDEEPHCSSCGAELQQHHHHRRRHGAEAASSSSSSGSTVVINNHNHNHNCSSSSFSVDGDGDGDMLQVAGAESGYRSMPDLRAEELHHFLLNADTDHDFLTLLHGSDPIKAEIDRLHNELRAKNREISQFEGEVKALKLNERSREKALEEATEELTRVQDKLERCEILVENKNLEIKRLHEERKEAQGAQYAAEATLRRLHASRDMKDEDMPPIEAIMAPLESEVKLARQEILRLQDDNRALDRLTKSKESALLEAERKVDYATARASLVDDVQNRNQQLMKQIEMYQEESKLVEKLHKQKVSQIEKLSANIGELEEQILSSAAHADNITRDFQRQLNQLENEKRTLQRELARANVAANRVAIVAANGWKDAHNHVMPVRQWLEERRFLQGEIHQLRDKLAMMERTAKVEAQLKEKVQLRLKVLEESLIITNVSTSKGISNGIAKDHATISTRLPTSRLSLTSSNVLVSSQENKKNSTKSRIPMRNGKTTSTLLQNKVNDPKCMSKSFNMSSNGHYTKSQSANQFSHNTMSSSVSIIRPNTLNSSPTKTSDSKAMATSLMAPDHGATQVKVGQDYVSSQFYDQLQKEVITLRKACQEKDRGLQDKENAIEMLEKKVNALQRTTELEAKRMRREVASIEKEALKRINSNDSNIIAKGNKCATTHDSLSSQSSTILH